MASPEQRLRELERSELFSSNFPRRRHLTRAQWAGLSEEQRREARAAQTTAIRRAVPDVSQPTLRIRHFSSSTVSCRATRQACRGRATYAYARRPRDRRPSRG
jgi:hypothetical protein